MNNLSGLLFALCGVTIFAYFVNIGCDPFTEGAIQGQNEVSWPVIFLLLHKIFRH